MKTGLNFTPDFCIYNDADTASEQISKFAKKKKKEVKVNIGLIVKEEAHTHAHAEPKNKITLHIKHSN